MMPWCHFLDCLYYLYSSQHKLVLLREMKEHCSLVLLHYQKCDHQCPVIMGAKIFSLLNVILLSH